MKLNYTEEQNMLRDSVSSYLADRYDIDQRRDALSKEPGWRPDVWKALAQELGLLGATFSEELGGFGGGAVENLVLMEEFGRSLVVEPYIGTVVIGGGFLKHSGHPAAADLITKIIEGEAIFAFAQAESNSRYNLTSVETSAASAGSGWKLNGQKKLAIGAPCATHLIVTARTSGESRDESGISVFLVDRNAPGVTLNEYKTFDGSLAADISFADVELNSDSLIGELDNGLPLIERVVDEAIAALCGEAVGVLKQLLGSTVAYSKERKQFGVPIGSFQALQHRMAEMFVDVELSESMAIRAAIIVDEEDAAKRSKVISMAKAKISKTLRHVGQEAIQIHGGMGMTEEMAVSHFFKRATILESLFGSADYHLARIEKIESL